MASQNGTRPPFVIVVGQSIQDPDSSGFALDQAVRIAARIPGSHLHLIEVLAADAGPEHVKESAGVLERYASAKSNELGGSAQLDLGVHVRRGDVAREIAQLAHEVSADMIVLGTHRRPHLKDLFGGTTAEHVMASAPCPVFMAGPKPPPEASHVIVIEPACPDCLATRAASGGQQWWCARHSEPHHLHALHRYSYQSELPFEVHDSEVSPTGV
ncbi:MAG TPA: universal stress protein [Polyangiaceae bacterium]|jgi:nucleotide-binding universal stress UspA family protein